MNSITLVGVLTKDPEPCGSAGRPICRMRLAESKAHPDHPLYINVSVFGPQAETCLGKLQKGSRVAVVGRLRFREWKRVDLSRRSEHLIAADRVDFLGSVTAEPVEVQGSPQVAPPPAPVGAPPEQV